MQPIPLVNQPLDLIECDVAELEARWRRELRSSPPSHLPRSILARLLAYRLQAIGHGDLPKPSIAFLEKIQANLEQGIDVEVPYVELNKIKPGTVLVREHDGVLHRVMALASGYAWEGKTFASLSAVAKAITGTSWNGNRFFGLKERKSFQNGVSA